MTACQVLFHDADGCLNPLDGSPLAFDKTSLGVSHERSLAELGAAVERSSLRYLVLNTGRSWETTEFLCDALASEKLAYALVEHGSELWDVRAKLPVSLELMAEKSAVTSAVKAVASRFDLSRLIEWFETTGAAELDELLGHPGALQRLVDKRWNLTFLVPDNLDGKLVFSTFKALVLAQAEFQSSAFVFHYSEWNRYLDVMAEMDKGLGATLLLEHLGIDTECSAAVGDGLNDLPMFRDVGIPICPANAETEVISACRDRGYVATKPFIGATMEWLRHIQ